MGTEIFQRLVLKDEREVVLINWERIHSENDRQRNIFLLDSNGAVIWQVADYAGIPKLSTFTNLIAIQDDKLKAHNFDGGVYEIDLTTGACKPLYLAK